MFFLSKKYVFMDYHSRNQQKNLNTQLNSTSIQKFSSLKISRKRIYGAAACLALASIGYYYYFNYDPRKRRNLQPSYALPRHDLPTYSIQEVEKHKDSKSVWVTMDRGVYDVTQYMEQHPGGEDLISLAAGGSLEFYWHKYPFHRNEDVIQILESMRIGNLEQQDRCKKPKFFPKIDPVSYKLDLVLGNDENSKKSLKLEDLKKNFSKHSISSTIPCKVKEGTETTKRGPVWSGARLSDVLNEIDFKKQDYDFVRFECMDISKSGSPYGSSIPIDKATDPEFQVLLAYEMNGNEIPIEHGYPVRVVMPQLAGTRNVKWLNKIRFVKKDS